MEQGKREDKQQIHAVRFAAGVAVLMACLERVAVVSLYEHRRVWVFLTLNLLLLVILFTSNHTEGSSRGSIGRSNNLQEEKYANDVKHKSVEEILKQCSALEPAKSSDDNMKIRKFESRREERDNERGEEEEEEENDAKKSNGLSKEELNDKAEAFIAMFRQQYLVPHHSKISKNRRKSHQKPVMGYHSHFIPSHISVGQCRERMHLRNLATSVP